MFVNMLAFVPLELPALPLAWQAHNVMVISNIARGRIVVPFPFLVIFLIFCNLGRKCKKIFNFFDLLISFCVDI